jgi:hypothetical protein
MAVFGSGYEIVTSSTRPSRPVDGQVIFETDSVAHRYYDAATTSWLPLIPIGMIKAFAGRQAPTGWLLCAGTAGTSITQASYPELFAVLTSNGTAYPYGGSGTTTYTPDLRGRAVHGIESMGGGGALGLIDSVATTLGGAGGNEFAARHAHGMANSVASANENTNHGHSWMLGGNGGALGQGDLPHRGFYGWDGNFATWGATAVSGGNTVQGPYGSGAQRHTHSFSFSGTSSGHSLTGGDQQNIAPAVVMNYIVRAR